MQARAGVVGVEKAKKLDYPNFLKHRLNDLKDLPAEIFLVEQRPSFQSLVHLALRHELASNRLATHKVKHRGEVSGTGRKPWQQKKTGRARAGSRRSPIFTGGGVVFGPSTERNYKVGINKRQYQLAFCSLLSQLLSEERLLRLDLNLDGPRCKLLVERLKQLELPRARTLIVSEEANLALAARNIPWIDLVSAKRLRLVDLYKARIVILSTSSLELIKGRFGSMSSQKREAKKRKLVVETSLEGR